ncbi:hypothetical protein B0I35DRAFT_425068 [Stachybotrys elegans]|uniref:ShKT domain-containing protein n=1 Tax=Stachybotrys elegans TaxID=80388 RepID=A0A8K0WV98_9HYPO|nr:hypothetical protein B0I35DRAFT_425068 [Stachybotrys elegans]
MRFAMLILSSALLAAAVPVSDPEAPVPEVEGLSLSEVELLLKSEVEASVKSEPEASLPPKIAARQCADLSSQCASAISLCNNQNYRRFMMEVCRRTCRFC